VAGLRTDYFNAATALQRHESNILRRLREHLAQELRTEAEVYELRATLEADPADRREQEWIAYGLRIAAAKVDPA